MNELLEHTEWVRALATRLVREDRDDAIQDLWVAALRFGPASGKPPKPWLAKVLQNAARRRFRDESTRARHERNAAAGEPETPEDLVGRVQVQRDLVSRVLELDEPFRQTVLLRFFEGLSAAEIAAQLDVPAGTVRWRLKEALDRLRVTLDATHEGGRTAWLGALAPLALPDAGPWLTAGVALLEKNVRLAVLVSVLVLGGLLSWVGPRWSVEAPGRVDRFANEARPAVDAQAPRPTERALAMNRSASAAPVQNEGDAGSPGPELGRESGAGGTTLLDAGTRFLLDSDGIQAAIQSALPDVRDCYESWLRLNPALGGKLLVTFTVDTDDGVEGQVTQLHIADGGIGHAPLEGCILSSLSELHFEPPLTGPLNVSYPFLLSPGDGGK